MAEGKKARILVIDDDENLLRMMGLLLERANYEYDAATNGLEGLSLAESAQPDLVVLDVVLPFMKGTEVCRRLRELSSTSHLPIIMMSNLERVEDKLAGFKAGADDYVTKPVNPKELLARINALLVRSQSGKPKKARIIALIGAKGGVGVSTVAVNLAAALQERERAVIVAELRSSHGALRYQLGVASDPHFGPLLGKEAGELVRAEVERCLVHHRSGMKLFLAPPGVSQHVLTREHVETILGVLEHNADYVILDLPPAMDSPVRRALELADQILMISESDLLSAACAHLALQTLTEWNLDRRLAFLGVSRVPSGDFLTRLELENKVYAGPGGDAPAGQDGSSWREDMDEGLGRGVIAVIPAAPESFQEALREGVPLVRMEPAARASRAFAELAERVLSSATLSQAAEL